MLHSVIRPLSISGFYGFFDYRYAEDYYFEGEHHHFWEVAYCLSGTVGISADEKVYRLQPGDLVVYRPYVHHKLWAEGRSKVHLMTVSFDASGDALERLGGGYSCDPELQAQWNVLFCKLKESGCPQKITGFLHYLEKHPLEYQQITNLCENSLLALAERGLPLGKNQSKNAKDYERIVRVMKENLSLNLTVEELGQRCGLSASSMKKLFRHFNSMGIHEYYLHLKMNRAVQLLEEGKTVTETAELLGFSNQSYFSTVFKREMKEVPARFRRNH
ncbi:MAG: helix-turn-helix transcriptional regulator [Clostridia bacterium]|nr:helix-turn-helix transcriptional regulator [Clostridia bacterium]